MQLVSANTDQPFYYLDNFSSLIQWVDQFYGHLLTAEEQRFIGSFKQLHREPAALLVRLLTRKSDQFRVAKLNYPEIHNLNSAITELVQHKLIEPDVLLSQSHLTSHLTLSDFRKWLGLPASLKKTEAKAWLQNNYAPELRTLSQWCSGLSDSVIEITCQRPVDRIIMLFFGNSHQDLSEFVLTDIDLYRYEDLHIDSNNCPFQSREDIDYLEALQHCSDYLEADNLTDALSVLPVIKDKNHWLNRRKEKLEYRIAYRLERTGNIDKAIQLYQQLDSLPARIRLIRVYSVQQYFETAWNLWMKCWQECQLGSPGYGQLELERMAKRLSKQAGQSFSIEHFLPAEFELILPRPEENYDGVEIAAARALTETGCDICFVENSLIMGLFGLWCWPALFAPVEGAFFQPFQIQPQDLYDKNFQPRREKWFNQLWPLLDADDLEEIILQRFDEKQGIRNPFVHWPALTRPLLKTAINHFPRHHIKAIFRHILADIRNHRSGLPDLIAFIRGNKLSYRLIEVKGPGDRLQENQRLWFRFFEQHHIPAQVCRVKYQ